MKKLKFAIVLFILLFVTGCRAQNFDIDKVDAIKEKESILDDTIIPTSVPTTNTKDTDNNSEEVKNNDVIVVEQAKGPNGRFYLDMTRKDVLSALDSMGIYDFDEVEITSDEDEWDWGNKVLETGDFSFYFDEDYKLYEIDIRGNNSTTLGLSIGESQQEMEKIYGDTYAIYETDNGYICEYAINGYYLRFDYRNDKICCWGISKYKLDKK